MKKYMTPEEKEALDEKIRNIRIPDPKDPVMLKMLADKYFKNRALRLRGLAIKNRVSDLSDEEKLIADRLLRSWDRLSRLYTRKISPQTISDMKMKLLLAKSLTVKVIAQSQIETEIAMEWKELRLIDRILGIITAYDIDGAAFDKAQSLFSHLNPRWRLKFVELQNKAVKRVLAECSRSEPTERRE